MSEQGRPVKKKRFEGSIARFGSTSISVHWTLLAAIVLISALLGFWFRRRYDELGPYATIGATVATLCVIVGSLLGRELTQIQIARHHGIAISKLSLSAAGARIRASSAPPYPQAEFQIAGGGLLFTCCVASTLFGLAALSDYYRLNPSYGENLQLLGFMNIVLAVANLVPLPPLDMGRIATAIFWHRRGSRNAGQVDSGNLALRTGAILAVVAIGLLFWSVLMSAAVAGIAILVAFVGRTQMLRASVRHRIETTTMAEVAIRNPLSLPDSMTVARVEEWASFEQLQVAYPITRWDSSPIGYAVPASAATLSVPERSWTKLGGLMQTREDVSRSWAGETVEEVLRRTPLSKSTIVVIHDPATMREVGTASYAQLQRLFVPPDFWGRSTSGQLQPTTQSTKS